MIDSLSPSEQRLIRELVFKLQPHSQSCCSPDFDPGAAIAAWLSHLQSAGKSPVTIKGYLLHLNHLLADFPQPTKAQIDAHLAECRAKGNGCSSLDNKAAAFKSFFSFCVDECLIGSNPASRLHYLKRPIRETKSPPPRDVSLLLSIDLTTRDRAMLYLWIDGGLRLSEARWIHVSDFGESSITVIGKGDKQRTVPLSQRAIAAIAELKRELPIGELFLFPGKNPGTPWNWRSIEERLDKLCKAAGIERITPHQLRHYYATHMLNQGANLKVVSQLLGHSSPSVTANVYWHVDAGERERQHELYSPLKQLEQIWRTEETMPKPKRKRHYLPAKAPFPKLFSPSCAHPDEASSPGGGGVSINNSNEESPPTSPQHRDQSYAQPAAISAHPEVRESIRRQLVSLQIAGVNRLLRSYSATELVEAIIDFKRELDFGTHIKNPNGFIRWLLPTDKVKIKEGK